MALTVRFGFLGACLLPAVGPFLAQPEPQDARPQYERILSGEDAKRVQQLDTEIARLQRGGDFARAMPLAQEVLSIRRSVQRDPHWQVDDADRRITSLTKLARLSAADQLKVAASYSRYFEAKKLEAARKYKEAAVVHEQVLKLRRAYLGDLHTDTMASYNNLGLAMRELRRFQPAELNLKKCVELSVAHLGTEHYHTAISYNDLAAALADQGKVAAAANYFEKSATISERVMGPTHRTTILLQANLTAIYEALNKFEKAEHFGRRAYSAAKKALGPDDLFTGRVAGNVAAALSSLGKHREAGPFFEDALRVSRKVLGESHPETAHAYNRLAISLSDRSRFKEARTHYEKALEIGERIFGKEHLHTAKFSRDLGTNLTELCEFEAADRAIRRALETQKKTLGESNRTTAATYTNLALNLQDWGRLADAIVYQTKAVSIMRGLSSGPDRDMARFLNNLAVMLSHQGKQAEAARYYKEALEMRKRIFGPEHLMVARLYTNLGTAQFYREDYPSALAYHERALQIVQQRYRSNRVQLANCHVNLGLVLDQIERFAEAEEHFRKADQVFRGALAKHGNAIESSASLANNLNAQGKWAEAEAAYLRAIELSLEILGKSHPQTGRFMSNYALSLWTRGEYRRAEKVLVEGLESMRMARVNLARSGLERSVAQGTNQRPHSILAALLARRGEAVEAWKQWEAGLAPGLFDDLATRSARKLNDADRRKQSELVSELQRCQELFSGSGIPSEEIRRQYDVAQARLAEFDEYVSSHYAVLSGKPGTIEDVQKHIPADTALVGWIDIARHPRGSHGEHWAVVLRSTGDPVWTRIPGTGRGETWTEDDEDLARQIASRLSDSQLGSSTAEMQRLLAQLQRQRMLPIKSQLAGIKRLIVLPSTDLANVPVQAIAPEFSVSHVPSATLLSWLRERPGKSRRLSLLALADPDYSQMRDQSSDTGHFSSLPGTRYEAASVARLFEDAGGSVRTLVGTDASEHEVSARALRGDLDQFRYLHFATHGVADSERAMQSALVLSPSPTPGGSSGDTGVFDGFLTAEQVLRTWQLNADLVVLSCCQSALGKYSAVEGYLGFSHALFLSGADSVILSLWKVDDTATALLMSRFYQNLLGRRRGLTQALAKSEALHEAQDWLRQLTAAEIDRITEGFPRTLRGNKAKPPIALKKLRRQRDNRRTFSHPSNWAAFILVGNPD